MSSILNIVDDMSSAVQPVLTDTESAPEDLTRSITKGARRKSGPFSDLINNRSMGSDHSPSLPDGTPSTKHEVASWLESSQSPFNSPNSDSEKAEKRANVFEGDTGVDQQEQVRTNRASRLSMCV